MSHCCWHGGHLAAIETAADDDKADAEDSGEAERERRACYPLRVA